MCTKPEVPSSQLNGVSGRKKPELSLSGESADGAHRMSSSTCEDIWSTEDMKCLRALERRLRARYSETDDVNDLRSAEDISTLVRETPSDHLSPTMQKLSLNSILLLQRFKHSQDQLDFDAVILLVTLATKLTHDQPFDAPVWLHALKIAQDMQLVIMPNHGNPQLPNPGTQRVDEQSSDPLEYLLSLLRIKTPDELHKALLSVLLSTARAGPSKVDEHIMETVLGPILAEVEDSDDDSDNDASTQSHESEFDLDLDWSQEDQGGPTISARIRWKEPKDLDAHSELHEVAEAQLTGKATPNDCQITPDSMSNKGILRTECYEDYNDQDNPVEWPAQMTPNKYQILYSTASKTSRRGTHVDFLDNLDDIDAAIASHGQAGGLISARFRESERLFRLAGLRGTRFQRSGLLGDLEAAIKTYSSVLTTSSNKDPMKPWTLVLLGGARKSRFEHLKDPGDLDAAIADYTEAIEQTPDNDPEKFMVRSSLASARQIRFGHHRIISDVDTAIQNYTQAVELVPESYSHKPSILAGLALAYTTRFDRCGDLDDLQAAIRWFSHAVQLAPREYPDKPTMLRDLASAHNKRFGRLGTIDDVDAEITAYTKAVELVSDDHPMKHLLWNWLGTAQKTRFERFYSSDDLDAAVTAFDEAVRLAPDDRPIKATVLGNLGCAYQLRFEYLGNPTDLEAAVTSHTQASERTAEDHPDRHVRLGNASVSLRTRFDRMGSLEDLETAIEMASLAVKLSPEAHESEPIWLNNLATSLGVRFERLGNLRDVDKSIVHLKQALKLVPDEHPQKLAFLNNFAVAQRTLFLCGGNRKYDDLVGSVQSLTKAIALSSDDHPDKPLMLSNLGLILTAQYNVLDAPDDLDSAIIAHSQAVELTPDGHHNKPRYLNNLGIAQIKRFERHRNLKDVEAAIVNGTKAALSTPEGHPARVRRWETAGRAIFARCCSPFGTQSDLENAFSVLKLAFKERTGYPPVMLDAAIRLADFISRNIYHQDGVMSDFLLHVHQRVLDLIPQVVWLGHDVDRRYEELIRLGTFSNKAAATAIAAGANTRAVEWLESGRSVVWSQVLSLRSPLDALKEKHRDIAIRLQQVCLALQGISSVDNPSVIRLSWPKSDPSLDLQGKSQYGLAVEYEKLLEHIRSLEGFGNFLRPKSFSQLIPADISGYVVLVNVHKSRCDALLLHPPRNVTHIPLPSFSLSRAERLQKQLRSVVNAKNKRHGIGRFQDQADETQVDNEEHTERGGETAGSDTNTTMRRILSELWNEVVKPVLKEIDRLTATAGNSGRLPHITWCPTGPLVFLPLHAAGSYPKSGSSETLMDYAVSSFTPTLEHLRRPRTSYEKLRVDGIDRTKPRILIVAKSTDTEGRNPIPNTAEEVKTIQDTIGASCGKITVLSEEQATVESVLGNMEANDWIHLACHGIQDVNDPKRSGFALHDYRLTLSMLMNKAPPNAELAVLSACQTATGDKRLSEEAVHLAAAMLNAGFKSVIGTMWSMSDNIAPQVARIFYECLRKQIEAREELQPAYALHEVIQNLRDTEGFLRWVPFVHFGL
ncbi:CHAT domain-containing protein [Irpex rosettiformis]|uniref:CHAT domain-containing protein n=1 Tax=Irpex rosettiformis TaxID=378272 RepID=A0ACB8U3Q1_9APHY|nr:CHAT domain-containing protein [Irpex rosettiformis]